MLELNVEKLKRVVKEIYGEPLPAHIHYHNWEHTQQVEDAVLRIAEGESVFGIDLIRLRCAALFHDVGNLITRENHEVRSAQIATELLQLFGASLTDIEEINRFIMATNLAQTPADLLEQIICDADLSLMGHTNWFVVINNYRKELEITDMEQWDEDQIEFLSNHTWFTATAKKLFDEQKQANLGLVRGLVERRKEGKVIW